MARHKRALPVILYNIACPTFVRDGTSQLWYEGKRADLMQGQNRFGCIFHTCRILSYAKYLRVPESTKYRSRPRRHSTANVSSAVHVFGLRTAVLSNPSACVWLAAQRTTTKYGHTKTNWLRSNPRIMEPSQRRRMSAIGTKRTSLVKLCSCRSFWFLAI